MERKMMRKMEREMIGKMVREIKREIKRKCATGGLCEREGGRERQREEREDACVFVLDNVIEL